MVHPCELEKLSTTKTTTIHEVTNIGNESSLTTTENPESSKACKFKMIIEVQLCKFQFTDQFELS